MIVERTLDVGICLDVLTDKTVFDSISEDGATFESLKVDVINDKWVKIEDRDCLIGVVQFKQMFNKCYDAHIHILPQFRRDYSVPAGHKLVEWIKEELTGCTIYTNVPSFCKNVIDYLKAFDFESNGRIPNAWKKNGKQNDLIIMTRGF